MKMKMRYIEMEKEFLDLNDLSEEVKEKFKEEFHAELERQFLEGEMIGSDDLLPSSEEELFRNILEDERGD